MERVDVNGLLVTYERAGHGPPVVLLHGYVGDAKATWHHQIEALSEDFMVIAWDAPGAGGSSDPQEGLGIAGYADCLAVFLDALGLRRAHIVGLSFGGALALELYHRHPSIPQTLVLASAYAGWRGSLPEDVAEARLAQALKLSELSSAAFIDTLLPTMFASYVSQPDTDAFRMSMEDFHPIGFRAMAYASAEDLAAVPSTVRVPTLLLYGDRDVRAPLAVAEHLREQIALSRLVVLEGVGHLCNIEDPKRFNEEVRAFLAEQSS